MRAILWLSAMAVLLGCGPGAPPPAVLVEKISGTVQPAPGDKELILARVAEYWQALAEQRWDIAYTMTTLDFQEAHPFHAWRRRQVVDYGAPRELVLLHWLKDSHRMPGPEVFAVTGWIAGPADDPIARGQMVWRLEKPYGFQIQSEEITVLKPRPKA